MKLICLYRRLPVNLICKLKKCFMGRQKLSGSIAYCSVGQCSKTGFPWWKLLLQVKVTSRTSEKTSYSLWFEPFINNVILELKVYLGKNEIFPAKKKDCLSWKFIWGLTLLDDNIVNFVFIKNSNQFFLSALESVGKMLKRLVWVDPVVAQIVPFADTDSWLPFCLHAPELVPQS